LLIYITCVSNPALHAGQNKLHLVARIVVTSFARGFDTHHLHHKKNRLTAVFLFTRRPSFLPISSVRSRLAREEHRQLSDPMPGQTGSRAALQAVVLLVLAQEEDPFIFDFVCSNFQSVFCRETVLLEMRLWTHLSVGCVWVHQKTETLARCIRSTEYRPCHASSQA